MESLSRRSIEFESFSMRYSDFPMRVKSSSLPFSLRFQVVSSGKQSILMEIFLRSASFTFGHFGGGSKLLSKMGKYKEKRGEELDKIFLLEIVYESHRYSCRESKDSSKSSRNRKGRFFYEDCFDERDDESDFERGLMFFKKGEDLFHSS